MISKHGLSAYGQLALAAGTAPVGVVLAAAGASGALLPPVGPVSRTLWRDLPDREDPRQAAFSLDATIVQVLCYAAGPLPVTLPATVGFPVCRCG